MFFPGLFDVLFVNLVFVTNKKPSFIPNLLVNLIVWISMIIAKFLPALTNKPNKLHAMKFILQSFIGFVFLMNLSAQTNKTRDPKSEGMVFIPQGSFIMQIVENKDTLNVTVSVEPFWMSNEITNAEYREYVDYVRQHPDSLMCWVDLEKASKDKNKTENRMGIQKYVQCIRYAELAADIIDTAKLPYTDYFTNKKYNSYPVVGVSQRHAVFYCQWKTQMVNRKLEKQGKPFVHDYRLPVEAEWLYAASQASKSGKDKNSTRDGIAPSISGAADGWGLYNLAGNVSEWTASNQPTNGGQAVERIISGERKIIRGGSWRTQPTIDGRKMMDVNAKEDYLGFRIVRSYLGTGK
jgi:formylglycine-generating enzyme required for sulfatase activity